MLELEFLFLLVVDFALRFDICGVYGRSIVVDNDFNIGVFRFLL